MTMDWLSRIDIYDFFFNTETGIPGMSVKALLVVTATALSWLIARRVLTGLEQRLKDNELIRANTRVFHGLRRAVFYLLTYLAGTYLVRLFHLPYLEKGLLALLIILMAGPLIEFTMILIRYLQDNVADKTETHVDDIIFDLLEKLLGAVIYATAVVLALDILGLNVMPFIAGAGVAGIAVGFAAKDTLSNLIAGVLLLIDRPFEIGDRIEVWTAPTGSATWGDVIDIGLRATKIRTTDHIVIIIPNNEIMTRDIINYTTITAKIRLRINIGISYDADTDKAKKLIIEVAKDTPTVSVVPAPKVVVRNFGESSVDLQLRVWIDNARERMNTISRITDEIKTVFDKHRIDIPFPRRDITIVEKPGIGESTLY